MPSRIIRIILQQFARYDALLKLLDKNVLVLALAFGVERERIVVCSDLCANMFKNIHAVLGSSLVSSHCRRGLYYNSTQRSPRLHSSVSTMIKGRES